jgi:hypothetical protein
MKKIILFFLICIVILGLVLFFTSRQGEEKKIVLAWSGISAIPTWAKEVSVETNGNSFSREFTMMFSGTAEEIDQWIAEEPVFKTAEKKDIQSSDVSQKGSVETYILVPQSGAGYAEVVIDRSVGRVKIRVYWS